MAGNRASGCKSESGVDRSIGLNFISFNDSCQHIGNNFKKQYNLYLSAIQWTFIIFVLF